jgi:Yip1-like protein
MDLVERVKKILLAPKDEWPRIAAESATVQSLYVGYIVILAAIGPLATLVSFSIIGMGFGIGAAVFAYIHSLVGVAILALIADLLAPTFGGTRDYVAAMKLVAYSFTALWIAQIALLIPVAGFLVVLIGLVYTFYLFYLGVPILKKSTADRVVPYTIVVVISAIVLIYLIGLIARSLGLGFGMGAGPMAMGPMGMPR